MSGLSSGQHQSGGALAVYIVRVLGDASGCLRQCAPLREPRQSICIVTSQPYAQRRWGAWVLGPKASSGGEPSSGPDWRAWCSVGGVKGPVGPRLDRRPMGGLTGRGGAGSVLLPVNATPGAALDRANWHTRALTTTRRPLITRNRTSTSASQPANGAASRCAPAPDRADLLPCPYLTMYLPYIWNPAMVPFCSRISCLLSCIDHLMDYGARLRI